ncbi:MAG: 1-deoxy-D-xylulose-5-phosphate reductoisomerase [Actinobacteria bacterium]|nr:1-deoxy-D-xylulose-5-phosphate reductoisomerase [Actinomycetota bacterium]
MGAPTTIRVAIAGSSGSIGTQTLDVVRAENARRDRDVEYVVTALGVGSSVDALIAQAREFRVGVVAVADPSKIAAVREALPGVVVETKMEALVDHADVVVNAVVGFAGLDVTLATLARGKRLALANKESLIAAGPVVRPLRSTPGAEIVPVDSEHCAVHQCLRATVREGVEVSRIVLTASGGPFRGRTADDLRSVTVDQALAHPTWNMGPKITIDSSTLMNKGLEVIEAHELFGVDYDDIDVVVHPQSIIHSMVEFTDGCTMAQLSLPDMRLPIGYALAHPHRISTPFGRIDWNAGRIGGTAPAFMSAANEIAVEHFLAGAIGWMRIAETVEAALQQHQSPSGDLVAADIIEADRRGREAARRVLSR